MFPEHSLKIPGASNLEATPKSGINRGTLQTYECNEGVFNVRNEGIK